MPDEDDTPSTEELATELAATEGDDNATETAPDPETVPDAPAEPEPEPAAPTPPESPADSPEPEAAPTPEPREIAPPSSAQADKKAAETGRRKAAIDAAERTREPVDPEEEKRKNAIREEMEAVTRDRDEFLAEAQGCQERLTELSAELYPHSAKSDTLVDAVRGHIKAQKKIRANRAGNPARIAEILKQAGKAPIDAAFHRQRARGMSRPSRSPATPTKPAEGDSSNANAGQE
jgi:hypothetical protein